MKYPNLEMLIENRGIKRSVIAKRLEIAPRSLKRKLDGESPFTWSETCKIQSYFFPDVSKDILFADNEQTQSSA